MRISNKTIKSLAIKTLLTASTILLNSQAMAGASVKHILSQYYPLHPQGMDCDGVMYEAKGYCMKVNKYEVVDTQYGEELYILVTGEVAFSASGSNKVAGAHTYTGLVGMFVLYPSDDGGYEVQAANPTIPMGSEGLAPDEWTSHKFSPKVWGFLTSTGYGKGGYMDYEFQILTIDGNGIKKSVIPSGNDNNDSGICGWDGVPECKTIKANIKINRSKVIDGFYPLDLTLNGKNNGKIYKNRKYQVPYSYNKGYKTPKDYPLN